GRRRLARRTADHAARWISGVRRGGRVADPSRTPRRWEERRKGAKTLRTYTLQDRAPADPPRCCQLLSCFIAVFACASMHPLPLCSLASLLPWRLSSPGVFALV